MGTELIQRNEMPGKKQKYYVVWEGRTPGVYASWEDCRRQTEHFEGAKFKSFASEDEARREFMLGYPASRSEQVKQYAVSTAAVPALPAGISTQALAVDAACSGNPGQMEYRGVYLQNRRQVFHFGPVWGTNNIGEFLAIVHALALMKQRGLDLPVYSDSRNAILWVRKKQCRTKLVRNSRTEELFRLIARAEQWLKNNTYTNRIIKWETSEWGEIPADFGRKH